MRVEERNVGCTYVDVKLLFNQIQPRENSVHYLDTAVQQK